MGSRSHVWRSQKMEEMKMKGKVYLRTCRWVTKCCRWLDMSGQMRAATTQTQASKEVYLRTCVWVGLVTANDHR
jgi:predicted TIM-barrel fold metal-dependent hydrolase